MKHISLQFFLLRLNFYEGPSEIQTGIFSGFLHNAIVYYRPPDKFCQLVQYSFITTLYDILWVVVVVEGYIFILIVVFLVDHIIQTLNFKKNLAPPSCSNFLWSQWIYTPEVIKNIHDSVSENIPVFWNSLQWNELLFKKWTICNLYTHDWEYIQLIQKIFVKCKPS